jgi:hypothetical protein
MAITFNPFTGNFDFTGEESTLYLPTVQSESDLPSGDQDGAVRIVRDTDRLYCYDLTDDTWTDSGVTVAHFSASVNSKGLSITVVADGVITNLLRPNLVLHAADASNPGGLSTADQEIGGNKDFQNNVIVQGQVKANTIDTLTNGATLGIGIADASTINIGRSGATVNIIGTTNVIDVTNLNVTDKNITVNDGGAAGSGSDAGIEVEENGSITAYNKVSADRNSWRLKAPNASGEVFIAPNNDGFSQVINSETLTSNRILTIPDITGTAVVTEGAQTINGNKTLSCDTDLQGTTTLSDLTGPNPLKINASSEIVTGAIILTSEVSGILPVANGGTNSNTALNGNRVMISAGGAIVEQNALTGNRALVSDATGLPVVSAVTDTELASLTGIDSNVQDQLDGKEPTITILPIAKGGTNSGTALNNNRIIESNGGALVERAALTDGQLIIGSTGANPVNASLTAGAGISITPGAGSISITNTTVLTGDIVPTTFAAAESVAAPADVTGLAFSNAAVRSFTAIVDVIVDATADLYQSFTIKGLQRGSDWVISQESLGDSSGVSFSITNSGQIQYMSSTYAGFSSLNMKFSAKVMPI